MDKDALIASYQEQKKTLTKVEKALEITKTKMSSVVKQIFEAHGKGPHVIDGREVSIVQKGETYFFLPKRGPKGAKDEATETPAATA